MPTVISLPSSIARRRRIASPAFRLCAVAGLFSGLAAGPALRAADVFVGDGHIDLNLGYSAGTGFAVNAQYSGPEFSAFYSVADAVFVLDDDARIASPGDSLVADGLGDYSFLGPQGTLVWVVDQVQTDSVPWVGFGTYGIGGDHDDVRNDFGVFDNQSVHVNYLGFTGPADAIFALWSYGGFGWLEATFSSDQALLSAPNSFSLIDGSHAHYAWAFTRPGDYVVHLALDGSIGGVAVPSGTLDVRFTVIPEPASFAVLSGLACAAAGALRRRPRQS